MQYGSKIKVYNSDYHETEVPTSHFGMLERIFRVYRIRKEC